MSSIVLDEILFARAMLLSLSDDNDDKKVSTFTRTSAVTLDTRHFYPPSSSTLRPEDSIFARPDSMDEYDPSHFDVVADEQFDGLFLRVSISEF